MVIYPGMSLIYRKEVPIKEMGRDMEIIIQMLCLGMNSTGNMNENILGCKVLLSFHVYRLRFLHLSFSSVYEKENVKTVSYVHGK